MVNLTRRFKLEYEDVNDGTTIIAEKGQSTGAPEIERHVHIRRKNDPDILKLWIEEPDFGNTIPTDRNDFANAQNGENEPEILYKQYDSDTDSFVTKGRFYAKNAGSINEDGQLAVKLYSFMKYTAKQDVNASSSQDLEHAMNQVLPPGYVADTPASTPDIDNYSVTSKREKGYQELTRNYNYALTFTAELDASNNYKVKFEPVGFGGTVDTLVDRDQSGRYPILDVDTGTNTFFIRGDKTNDLVVNQVIQVDGSTGNDGSYTISALNYDSTDNETDITVNENVSDSTADGSILPGGNAKFENWEKDKTESVVNKVEVIYTDSNEKSQSVTADNTTMQDKVGVKKETFKIGYVKNSTRATEIAESYLKPGKDDQGNDISELPESGRVKTAVYSDNVVNDSFQVVSNRLNIDDTYTVVQQRNFWPEGASKIEFEFEQEGLEKVARESENLREERSRLFSESQTDVGGQGMTTGDALSNTAKTGGVGDSGDRNDDTSNVSKIGGVGDSGDRGDDFSNVNKIGGVQTGQIPVNSSISTTTTSFTLSNGGTATESTSVSYNGNLVQIYGQIETDGSAGDKVIVELKSSGFAQPFVRFTTFLTSTGEVAISHLETVENISGDTVDFNVGNISGSSITVNRQQITVAGEKPHSHSDDIDTDNQSMGLTDDVDTDNQSMGLTDNIDTDDNQHGGGSGDDQHGGTTDSKNISVATEDKTDRS